MCVGGSNRERTLSFLPSVNGLHGIEQEVTNVNALYRLLENNILVGI